MCCSLEVFTARRCQPRASLTDRRELRVWLVWRLSQEVSRSWRFKVLWPLRMKLHNPHSLQSFQSPVEGWWTWGCQNMVHLQDPASLLNWLRHLLEMRLSEGWPLVRQQWRCRKGRRWWCGLLSYPMGLVGDRGEAFPDNDRHPFPINFQRHWKFPLGKLPGCHQMPSVSRLPDPFCYLLRHDTAGALKKNQWKSAVHWDVGMGQTSGA